MSSSRRKNYYKKNMFSFSFLPQTYNTDRQVPDSAGTATAMFSGVKTRAGMLGLDGTAAYNVCAPASIQVFFVTLQLVDLWLRQPVWPPWLTGQLERGKRWVLFPINEKAKRLAQYGKSLQVGVVSTARLTHATPGAMYSHNPNRNWEADADLPTDSVGCTDTATQVFFQQKRII